jgi:hypothetical protein
MKNFLYIQKCSNRRHSKLSKRKSWQPVRSFSLQLFRTAHYWTPLLILHTMSTASVFSNLLIRRNFEFSKRFKSWLFLENFNYSFIGNKYILNFINIMKIIQILHKVKLSLYKPWRPLVLREVEVPTFSDIWLTVDGKVVSPRRRSLFTPRKIPGTHFC